MQSEVGAISTKNSKSFDAFHHPKPIELLRDRNLIASDALHTAQKKRQVAASRE
jgi:hypothetical protein